MLFSCLNPQLRELILRLSEEYPGDIGIMMPLLLNYLRMGKGESFFMAANEPHAYLKGDILEVRLRPTIPTVTYWYMTAYCCRPYLAAVILHETCDGS